MERRSLEYIKGLVQTPGEKPSSATISHQQLFSDHPASQPNIAPDPHNYSYRCWGKDTHDTYCVSTSHLICEQCFPLSLFKPPSLSVQLVSLCYSVSFYQCVLSVAPRAYQPSAPLVALSPLVQLYISSTFVYVLCSLLLSSYGPFFMTCSCAFGLDCVLLCY